MTGIAMGFAVSKRVIVSAILAILWPQFAPTAFAQDNQGFSSWNVQILYGWTFQQPGIAEDVPKNVFTFENTSAGAREILQEPLSGLASRVDVAASGKEAIAAIQQKDGSEPYDLVFMDWRMPGMDGLQASRQIKSDETLKHPPHIVLVTAFGREEVREEAERLNLDGFLVKPVTKSMIVDTLVNVFAAETGQAITAVEVDSAARLSGARILLTEDNEINQQIAIELLEGTGATVTVANNGREAVEILSGGPQPPPFDVVLMDLQMPEMDGFQATAQLRGDGRFGDLPIIARTAHATLEVKSREAAATLIALFAACDASAPDFIEVNRPTLRPLFTGETWTEFEALVQDYAFSDAQDKLEQALHESIK